MEHPVTIVHAADLHLDSPMLGIERYEGAPVEEARAATRRAFEAVIALCLERQARLLLLAGDIFDGEWRDYQSGIWFLRQLGQLRACGTQVTLVRGNHDAHRGGISSRLSLPEHVHRLSEQAPQTVVFDDLGIAVHGQSHAKPEVSDNLALGFPPPLPGVANIGLLHTNVGGTPGHGNYAPCRLADLTERGYDYWALGHIHARQALSEAPWVVYPGCTQGRSVRETGPKGCIAIEIADARIASVEFVETDVMRWEHLAIDVREADTAIDDIVGRALAALDDAARRAEGRAVAARVTLTGATTLHGALVRGSDEVAAELRAHAHDSVWIEKTIVATRPRIDRQALRESDGALGALLAGIERIRSERDTATLAEPLGDLRRKVGRELAEHGEIDLEDEETLLRLLDAAEDLLLERLAGGES